MSKELMKKEDKANLNVLAEFIIGNGDMWLDINENLIVEAQKDLKSEEPDELRNIAHLYYEKADLIEVLDICNEHKESSNRIAEKIRADLKRSDAIFAGHKDEKAMNKFYLVNKKPN